MIRLHGFRSYNLPGLLALLSLALFGHWPAVLVCQASASLEATVILDPGHGGEDPGAQAAGNVEEKQITLELARKVAQVLRETGIARPLLTRRDDRTVSLDERAGLANSRRGDLLVSLHVGTSFRSAPLGFTLYYWSPTTAVPALSGPAGQKLPWDQQQLPYWHKSRRLAKMIEQQVLRVLPWPSGGVLRADLYLLRRVRMPAVLLELGSLSDPTEAAQLQNPELQQTVARALAEAISRYENGEFGRRDPRKPVGSSE